MSSVLATILALIVYAIALLPIAIIVARPSIRAVALGYVVALLALALWQTGVFQRSTLAPTDAVPRAMGQVPQAQCREVLRLLRQSGLSVDRSDPQAPKIVGTGAEQVPPEVRDVLISCSAAT